MPATKTIRTILTRTNGLVITACLLLSAAYVYSTHAMSSSLLEISKARMPAIQTLNQIKADSDRIVQVQARILLTPEPGLRESMIREFDALEASLPKLFSQYTKFFRDDEDRKRFAKVTDLWGRLQIDLHKVHMLEKAGNQGGALAGFNNAIVPSAEAFSQALYDAAQDVADDADAATAHGERVATLSWIMAIGAGIVATGLSVAVIFISRRRVLVPLAALDEGLAQMAGGDFDIAIPGADAQDEIGAIARSVEKIKRNVADKAAAEAVAQKAIVDALGEGLQAMAAGRLGHKITSTFPPEYESLRQIFNEAMADLNQMISNVAGTAGTVGNASAELSSASLNLAERTELQASRLESTSSAIRGLTQTVRETADKAAHVNSGADLAQTQAADGARVAGDAMEAMREISHSSSQISQITDVIDGISFQTNLLALNAGVEAARAGDAGRGFAVVANEVRALAQRSADAAKSIKQLISESTAQVDKGVTLVSSSGVALNGIVEKVSELKTLIEGISAATNDQAGNLEGLSTTVHDMEMMTQQNAAMVEETSAAARHLQEESVTLLSMVRRFQASDDAGGSAGRSSVVAMVPPAASLSRSASAPARRAPVAGNLAVQSSPASAEDDWGEF